MYKNIVSHSACNKSFFMVIFTLNKHLHIHAFVSPDMFMRYFIDSCKQSVKSVLNNILRHLILHSSHYAYN